MVFCENTKLWMECRAPSVFNPNSSLANVLLKSMKIYGSKIAQLSDDSGKAFTFDEIRLMTIRAAQNLQKRGHKTTEIFGFIVDNEANLAPIVFASLCLGCPINPLFRRAEKSDVIKVLKMTKPSAMFIDVERYDLVKECLTELGQKAKIFTFNGQKRESETVENLFVETGTEDDFIPIQVDPVNHIAAIMNSSGTTGSCKGVSLSHASFLCSLGNYDIVKLDDIFFNTSALGWVTGLISMLLGTVNGATRLITTETFSVEMQLRIITKRKVSVCMTSVFHLGDIVKNGLLASADLSSIRRLIVSGGKVPFAVMEQMNAHLPNGNVNNGYGLTEMSGYVTMDFPDFSGKNTIGRLLNGFQMKIVDEMGNRCGIDTYGELCFKPPYKFLGYYGNEELTKKAVDDEGFFLTGDIGRVDEDGYIFYSQRQKDIISYEEWIVPSEIEDVLFESAHIKNACVVGVTIDENKDLEAPAVAVVRADHSQITEEDVFNMVADNLADHYKLRCGVYFVDSIPQTSTGKPLRRLVREFATRMYQSRQLNDSSLVVQHSMPFCS